jgi:uncharacterized protein
MPLALTDRLSPDVPVEGELCIRLPLHELTRLRDVLLDPPGRVDVTLTARNRDGGLVLVDGRMEGSLRVTCQRCLEPVDIRVAREIRVALVKAGDDTAVAEGFETWPLEQDTVTVRSLLEDELLLALPLVTVHADSAACGELANRLLDLSAESAPAAQDHPFAVLKKLKR